MNEPAHRQSQTFVPRIQLVEAGCLQLSPEKLRSAIKTVSNDFQKYFIVDN